MCDTVVAADPEVSEIFTDCKESWSDDGFLTLTTKVSLNALSEEYDKVDIDSLKAAFTQQGMDCTIK